MKWSDLLESSLGSLRQRFFRTALTVLGVLIGTTSVVVMVSLGIGMSQSMMDSMANNATMTRVTVYPGNSGGGGGMMGPVPGSSGSKDPKEKVMDAKTIAELQLVPGVTKVTPVYNVGGMAKVGKAEGYLSITAMPREALADEGFEFGQGRLPEAGDGLAIVVGNKVHWNFGGTTGPDGQWHPAEVNWMTDQVFVTFENPNAQQGTDGTPVQAKRFILPVTGVLAGNDASWSSNDMSVFADLDQVINALRKAYPGKALPGQPATADGKPKGNTFVYSQLNLTAESVQRAEELTTELRQDGYNVSSNIELIRQMQQQSAIIQAVFGGIGFISLLVAAIGIANTMMMSVYERTKQIGIMKVLGASLRDIRNMFLVESACIGLIGGVVGLLLSMLLSGVLNVTLGAAASFGGTAMKISIIPPYLMIAAVVFSTAIGTVAGVAPAQRAMKLSPLAAIRSE